MNCPCGERHSMTKQYFNVGEKDFRICPSCLLVFREEFPTISELENIYAQAYSAENIIGESTKQESGSHAAQSYAQYLSARIQNVGSSVLDFGAGTGALVDELRKYGISAEGLEFSSAARDYCKRKRNIMLLESLDKLEDGCFSTILMIEVIEHLSDLHGTLRSLKRVLAPDGRLFVTTPNRNSLRARRDGGMWLDARKKFHLFLFDWRSLKLHLDLVGFRDVKRVIYSPITNSGWNAMVKGRMLQTVGLSGSLCVWAKC